MRYRIPYKHTGMALILVLWMLVVMTAMTMAFSDVVRTEVLLASNYYNNAKATALAESGVWRGAAMILNRATASSTGNSINLAGSIYSLDSEAGTLQVSLQSCNGLVDLNRAPPELVRAVLERVEVSNENIEVILDSLLDWRDEDNLKRLKGAEEDDYRAHGVTHGPSNGLMNSVSELAWVNGVSPAIYTALKPLVTVYSGQSKIDINTAPYEVLRALPGVLADRADSGKKVDLSLFPTEASKYIEVGQNEFFKISSFARVNNLVSGIIAIVKIDSTHHSPVKVISWRHDIDAQFKDKRIHNE